MNGSTNLDGWRALPPLLLPRKVRFGLIDYDKAFCPDPDAGDVFDLRGIDSEEGCLVLVRPDQYIAHVLPLESHEELADFLGRGPRRRATARMSTWPVRSNSRVPAESGGLACRS